MNIEKEAIKHDAKRGIQVVGAAVGAVGIEKDIRAVHDWSVARSQNGAISDATKDLGLVTRDLAFQTPETPNIRGVIFYKGSVHPNPDNAVGTAIHARYKLIEAKAIPEADRVQVIVQNIENERAQHPGSDFVTPRNDLAQLATDLGKPAAHLGHIENAQYGLGLEGTSMALVIPAAWIGIKKLFERKNAKSDPKTEKKRSRLSRLWERITTLPSENKEQEEQMVKPLELPTGTSSK